MASIFTNILNWKQWIICFINIAYIAIMFIQPIQKYDELPKELPVHFNIHGECDRYASKRVIFMLPIISIIILILMIIGAQYPDYWNLPIEVTDNNYDFASSTLKYYVLLLAIVIINYFSQINATIMKGVSFKMGSVLSFFISLIILTLLFLYRLTRGTREEQRIEEGKEDGTIPKNRGERRLQEKLLKKKAKKAAAAKKEAQEPKKAESKKSK